jgi:hypothetical protein
MDAPMWPDEPPLMVHPKTRELFWVEDCEVVESPDEISAARSSNTPFAENPDASDWLQAIESGMAGNSEQLRSLLIWFWWIANDEVRKTGRLSMNLETFRLHASRLVEVLDKNDPNDRMMAAEAARQTGQFALAAELLNFDWPEEYLTAVERVRSLAESGDTLVRKLLP